MSAEPEWVTYLCSCGFRLEHVPRQVVADLPRCLGCGKGLRGTAEVRTRAVSNVRDLR